MVGCASSCQSRASAATSRRRLRDPGRVINTGTTIVTFLMVFVIQDAQDRDAKAVHAKLDELTRAVDTARDEFVHARPSRKGSSIARSRSCEPWPGSTRS